jgi:uncharacterized protein YdhG (YjbR/CyaY superfamily)
MFVSLKRLNMSAPTPDAYIAALPVEQQGVVQKLRTTILKHLPKGFQEEMSYGMIGYVVPHSVYPSGYHCSPKLPLPFLSMAAKKNGYHLYHMGMYAQKEMLDWYAAEYSKQKGKKADVGKSCIRFKKEEDIPFELIAQLVAKMTPKQWIEIYEREYKK